MDVKQALREYSIDFEETERRFMVVCPFHDDSHPSCGIWKDSGHFKCFGCHEEGDLAEFISEVSGVPASSLRRRYRVPTAVDELEDKITKYLEIGDKELEFFSVKSFHKTFPRVEPGTPEWEYLTGRTRHLNKRSIRRFDIRSGGTKKYKNRVIVPIFTDTGKLLAYVGRAIKPDMIPKTRKNRSPHRAFFGLFELLRDTDLKNRRSSLVVVEGEFDSIYLQQLGVPAISNMGTSEMSPDKVRLLRKYASKVILSYDPDEAGERAMYGYENKKGYWKPGQYELLKDHVPTLTVELPGKDPNDLTPEEVEDVYGGLV